MQLTRRLGFLVITGSLEAQNSRVAIKSSLEEAIDSWDSSTRLSPLYGLGEDQLTADEVLQTANAICFLGCDFPESLLPLPEDVRLWAVTLGIFNIIVYSKNKKALAAFAKQVHREKNLQYEIWFLDNQKQITDVKHPPLTRKQEPESVFPSAGAGPPVESPAQEKDIHQSLARMASKVESLPSDLRTGVSEYCTLMASSWARAAQARPVLKEELLKPIHDYACRELDKITKQPNDMYLAIDAFTNINAGLSRFCAQTLSGISPIHQTECHFWIHSLLGTGVGNLALYNFAKFVSSRMESLNLPGRLETKFNEESLDYLTKVSNEFWLKNHCQDVSPSLGQEQPTPLITYFSSRDGFHCGHATASAPLASLGACNAPQWSLMAMTHEICHRIVDAVLIKLYPNPATEEGKARITAWEARKNNQVSAQKPTLRDQMDAFLLATLAYMSAVDGSSADTKNVEFAEKTSAAFRNWESKPEDLLERWQHEVEEIMVHALDFLYCYGQDTDQYVRVVWNALSVIPELPDNKIEDLVIRTLCAVLTKEISNNENGKQVVRKKVIDGLLKLSSNDCIERALELLNSDEHWNQQIKYKIDARENLVKLVVGYLYWKDAEVKIRGGDEKQSQYSSLGSELILPTPLDNPLRLVEACANSSDPDEVASVLLLYRLAFLADAPGR